MSALTLARTTLAGTTADGAKRHGAVPDVLVLDTCVLISSVLRALLLRLAHEGWYEPVWSPIIGDEWRRTAARLWKAEPEDIARQWASLQADFPAADMGEVVAFKQGLVYSDPKDWHVIAAARVALTRYPGKTVAVVTRNIRDFHRTELRRLRIGLLDPDGLVCRMWQQDPHRMAGHLEGLPSYARAPGKPLETLEAMLKRERLFRLNRLFHMQNGPANGAV